MLMSKEKHIKWLLVRSSCCLEDSYLSLGSKVYTLLLFVNSLLILDSYQLTFLSDVLCLSKAAQRDLTLL